MISFAALHPSSNSFTTALVSEAIQELLELFKDSLDLNRVLPTKSNSFTVLLPKTILLETRSVHFSTLRQVRWLTTFESSSFSGSPEERTKVI